LTHIWDWTIISLSQEFPATFLQFVYKKEMLTELNRACPHGWLVEKNMITAIINAGPYTTRWDKPVGMDAWCVSLPASVPWNVPHLTDSLCVCLKVMCYCNYSRSMCVCAEVGGAYIVETSSVSAFLTHFAPSLLKHQSIWL